MDILKEDVEVAFLVEDGGHDDDSNTFDEVISDIDSEKWLDTMKSEIDSIH